MKPCPNCGSPDHTVAFSIRENGTTVAVRCLRCEHVGPEVRMTFPPSRVTLVKACNAWDRYVAMRHNRTAA